tara:strand:- start:755 stop:997 length:243 start_codon:yes stop_codon:yes gene_type:complete
MITIEEINEKINEDKYTIRYYIFYTDPNNKVKLIANLSAKEFTNVLECVNNVDGSFARYFENDIHEPEPEYRVPLHQQAI